MEFPVLPPHPTPRTVRDLLAHAHPRCPSSFCAIRFPLPPPPTHTLLPGGPLFSVTGLEEEEEEEGSEGQAAPAGPQEVAVRTSLTALLTPCAVSMRGGVVLGLQCAASGLVRLCTGGLGGVQTISTFYRMTNKPLPSKPFPYVAKLLKPLQDFLLAQGMRAPVRMREYVRMHGRTYVCMCVCGCSFSVACVCTWVSLFPCPCACCPRGTV
jgi:hypothetical protein